MYDNTNNQRTRIIKSNPVAPGTTNPILQNFNGGIGTLPNQFTGNVKEIQHYINRSARKYSGLYSNISTVPTANTVTIQMPGDGSLLIGIRIMAAAASFNVRSTWTLNNEAFISKVDLFYFFQGVQNPSEYIPVMRPFAQNTNLIIEIDNQSGAAITPVNFILIYV